jgi:hypothetical protein
MVQWPDHAALLDVPETKGVCRLEQNVSNLYLIQIKIVTLKYGSRGEKEARLSMM